MRVRKRNPIIRVMSRPGELKAPLQRERSLQDIDKDIETIWKELQDLDTPAVSERTQGGTEGTDRGGRRGSGGHFG